jgi:hypothetical protein
MDDEPRTITRHHRNDQDAPTGAAVWLIVDGGPGVAATARFSISRLIEQHLRSAEHRNWRFAIPIRTRRHMDSELLNVRVPKSMCKKR